jgi:hypothetical protein
MRKDAGDLKAAQALVEEALALSKALGDVRMHVGCETQLAVIECAAGQMAEAIGATRPVKPLANPLATGVRPCTRWPAF